MCVRMHMYEYVLQFLWEKGGFATTLISLYAVSRYP